jgi:Zn-dependent protease with chaperone function
MDFFNSQDKARRKTLRLVLLFSAAVLGLIILTNLVVAAGFVFAQNFNTTIVATDLKARFLEQITPVRFGTISAVVVCVVVMASLYKLVVLSSGGRAIAEMLGGRLVPPMTQDLAERRLINVVEEMAIASGTPVPPVYVMDDEAINAFAAGYSVDDAVLGVTRGTLKHLNRDELQGVIAHEFSHIVNGDSRLNIRLMAALHGILVIGIIGYGILRGMGRTGGSRRGGSAAPALVMGLGLMVVGYAGTFFGNLIKAAVSRQREFLADASAVQFTRQPEGIAGALKKIGGFGLGSKIESTNPQEASHIFFGQAISPLFSALMDTHPPLEKRIKAIEPRWNGRFPKVEVEHVVEVPEEEADVAVEAPVMALAAGAETVHVDERPLAEHIEQAIEDRVGRLEAGDLDRARELIASIPKDLLNAARDPWGGRALVYALLLDVQASIRAKQVALVQERAESGVPEFLTRSVAEVDALPHELRVPLLELVIPALKSLSETQYARFSEITVDLIKADEEIELFEWVLHELLIQHLKPHFGNARPVRPRYRRPEQIREAVSNVLSTLAQSGHDGETQRQRAFEAGRESLGISLEPNWERDANPRRFQKGVSQFRRLYPLAKPRVLKALAACAGADGEIRQAELDLLKGISAALDCPMPPLSASV